MTATGDAPELTALLQRWRDGDESALGAVVERTYQELKKLARSHLRREQSGHSLQPTALVNELYVRLAAARPADWKDRHHFFALASRMMRRLLIDYARRQRGAKRRGVRVTLDEGLAQKDASDVDVIALDRALTKMEASFPREARVVELRWLCGLTVEETAECLSVATGTVKRDWRFAKGFLFAELQDARG